MTKEFMNRRETGFFFLGVLLMVLVFVAFKCSGNRSELPTLAGQKLPANMFQIDFSKRYNIFPTGGYGSSGDRVYQNVKILGFVGSPEGREKNAGSFMGSDYFSYFGKWLVLELYDTRKVYLPVSAIGVIEEAGEGDKR
jgi:hypothetical protein